MGVVCPVLTVLAVTPITLGALAGPPDDRSLLVAPTALALVAAPGYLRAVLGWVSIPQLSLTGRLWVRLSFAMGLIAAGIGAVIGLAFILPSLAALITAVTIVVIWRRLEARRA